MKRNFRNKRIWLAAAVAALVMTVSVPAAMAYFTDYTTATGSVTLHMEGRTDIIEEMSAWTKEVRIVNTGEKDVYVRAAAFAGSLYDLTYAGEGWTLGADGYYYYDKVLHAGETSDILRITIGDEEFDPASEQFSVVVVQECVPVIYRNGEPQPADWTSAIGEEG